MHYTMHVDIVRHPGNSTLSGLTGFVGDCWLMSSIACMATHPSKLKSLFKEKHLTEDGQCT